MDRESIIAALFAKVTAAPCIFAFTADVADNSIILANVSDATRLRVGLPLFGPGIPDLAEVATVTPQVTMSLPATSSAVGASLRQGFQTTGRRLKWADEINAFPAVFVVDGNEEFPPRGTGMPPKTTIEAEIWIYSSVGRDPDAVPATSLNRLIGAVIDDTLAPSPVTNVQNLGGRVTHCWVEGQILKDPGHADTIAKAVIPIRMLVP